MDDRGDLVSAVEDTRVREDSHTTGSQSRSEVPLPPALEALERSLLAHRLVLGPVELVDLLLESTAIELHRGGFSPIRVGRRTAEPPSGRARRGPGLLNAGVDLEIDSS